MDSDLTQARIEFARLEAKALTEVRTALSAQWINITSLLRQRPTTYPSSANRATRIHPRS